MNGLFVFLFLLSLIMLPVVIIKPNLLGKITKREFTKTKAGMLLGGITLTLFILIGITTKPTVQSINEQKAETTTSELTFTPTTVPQTQKQTTPIPTPKPTIATAATKPKSNITTIEDFPKKLEDYLNYTWDEMPETRYKVYWWETWEDVSLDPSSITHLVVEPNFEPTKQQCQRIAQVATIDRTLLLGKKEGVVHVVEYDNSGDYCSLRTP